ncbi:hypothetical protein CAOG_009421 [Capsaspora owczarzaki ATCC 30864]|uniref:Uncharacterized protein n=1 Tax=Capsaspora owczarzaki (strain ATCC 30864) TaxID=595528 RepID=A0A0D2WJ24_CAPO3|nr:hypothetical protein CAOG_009421 [Capsaspora owczarzaki ATCC 30864]
MSVAGTRARTHTYRMPLGGGRSKGERERKKKPTVDRKKKKIKHQFEITTNRPCEWNGNGRESAGQSKGGGRGLRTCNVWQTLRRSEAAPPTSINPPSTDPRPERE